MKERVPGSDPILYSRCCVLDAPPDVPDGSYTVFFDGHCARAIRQGGLWLPEDRAEPVPPDLRCGRREELSFRIQDAIDIMPLLKSEVA